MGAVTGDNCPQVSYGPHQGRPPDHPSLPLRVTPDRASLRERVMLASVLALLWEWLVFWLEPLVGPLCRINHLPSRVSMREQPCRKLSFGSPIGCRPWVSCFMTLQIRDIILVSCFHSSCRSKTQGRERAESSIILVYASNIFLSF